MTDKDIKDYCKNCDVEPPAMRFKCPECEHNTDNENIFAKDINVPRKEQINDSLKNPNKNFNENCTHEKEQIIIDGVDVSGCKFFNDITESYYCFGIPCKDRPNCYFKQLARKTQECEELKKELNSSEKWRIKSESLNEKLSIEKYRYRKALEDIEKHIESYKEQCNIPNNCVDNRLCSTCFLGGGNKLGENILDIINKAKGEEKCQ